MIPHFSTTLRFAFCYVLCLVLGFVCVVHAQDYHVSSSEPIDILVPSVRASSVPRVGELDRLRAVNEEMPARPAACVKFSMPCIAFHTPASSVVSIDRLGYGFDLWAAAERLNAPSDSSLVLSFNLKSEHARVVFISLGCSDQFVAYCNGRAVYAVTGARSMQVGQHVFAVPLNAGSNLLSVLFQRLAPWASPPHDHFELEWAVDLRVLGSASQALAAHRKVGFHPVIEPIVNQTRDLCVEVGLPGYEEVSLNSVDGVVLARGSVAPDGRITWRSLPKEEGILLAFLCLDGELAEPVLILNGQNLDGALSKLRSILMPAPEGFGGYSYRFDHLLKPQFAVSRDFWWKRKLLQVIASLNLSQVTHAGDKWRMLCPSLRLELREYTSLIDGSKQYYHLFKCKRRDRPIPLEVILPSTPSTIRPYLEGSVAANLRGMEHAASVADDLGIDLVWPGVVDVDYGGYLCQAALSECIEAAHAARSTKQGGAVFMLGTCSSGIASLRYAAGNLGLGGLILHTPMIARARHKPSTGAFFNPNYPPSTLDAEQTLKDLGSLAHLPVFLLFDTDELGHGDKVRAMAFEHALKAAGGTIISQWPIPFKAMPWGERDRSQMRLWRNWIAVTQEQRDAGLSSGHPVKEVTQIQCVKEALTRGFRVDETADPSLSTWRSKWFVDYAAYRGTPPALSPSPKTRVIFKVLNADELNNMEIATWSNGVAQCASTQRNDSSQWPVFGFRLVTKLKGEAVVEVVRSGSGLVSLPPMDLMLDGCCRAALWRQTPSGRWTLWEVWL